jgi:hypothetical protein
MLGQLPAENIAGRDIARVGNRLHVGNETANDVVCDLRIRTFDGRDKSLRK